MIVYQLLDLADAFDEIGIKPVICGGLGIYLCFYNQQSELPLRATNDIDLILTKPHIFEQSKRNDIAEIITDKLKYIVCESGKHFQFKKGNQHLDILTQPVEGVNVDGFRSILVKSKLHGHDMPEAAFVEEDLKVVPLSRILPKNEKPKNLEVFVPSLTNQLIFKLFAFDNRNMGQRKDDAQAQSHAFDIYMVVTFANLNDYREGQKFLFRHRDSEIIMKAKNIVRNHFSSVDEAGWHRVLETASFYPSFNIQQKYEKIDEARRRLVRWFTVPK